MISKTVTAFDCQELKAFWLFKFCFFTDSSGQQKQFNA